MLVIELIEMAAGGLRADGVERGSGVSVDAGARVQPEAAEQPLLVGGEVGVGQAERGGDRTGSRRASALAGPGRRPNPRRAGRRSRRGDGATGGGASRWAAGETPTGRGAPPPPAPRRAA